MLSESRIKSVYRYLYNKGLVESQKDFAKKICANQTTVSCALNGNARYLTNKLCKRIVEVFQQISYDWLVSGVGSMLLEDNPLGESSVVSDVVVSGNTLTNSPYSCNVMGKNLVKANRNVNIEGTTDTANTLPMIPASIAIKGNLDVWEYMYRGDVETCRYPSFPMFADVKLYYTVRLNAMSPRFEPGDVLALAPFPKVGTIIAGNPYIVDTYSMGFVFRLVYERGSNLECRALNKESIYEDFFIDKHDVIRLYRVLGMIRLA